MARSFRSSKRTRAFLIGVTLVLAAGLLPSCAPLRGIPDDPEDTAATLTILQTYFVPDKIMEYENADSQTRLSLRNKIVLNRMLAYDITFSDFKRRLAGDANSVTLGGDLLILALGGLTATTGGAATKAALGAASAGIAGAQAAINRDLYFQRTLPALLAQMDASRAQAKLAILSGLRLSDEEYPLQRALVDLDALRDAGSVVGAIGNITQAAEQQKADAQSLIFQRDAGFLATTPDRVAIKQRIDKLKPPQILALARIMMPNLATRSATLRANLARLPIDQTRVLTDPNTASSFLEDWIAFEDPPTAANLGQWSAALDQVERMTVVAPSGSQSPRRRTPGPPSGLHGTAPVEKPVVEEIRTLKDAQILALAKIMAPHLDSRSPHLKGELTQLVTQFNLDLTKPDDARRYLVTWAAFDDPPNISQWTAAIKATSR